MTPQFLQLLKAFIVGPLLFATSQQQGELTSDERDLLAFVGIGTMAFGIIGYFQQYGTLPEQPLTAEPGEIIEAEVIEETPEGAIPTEDVIPQWPTWITPGYWWK